MAKQPFHWHSLQIRGDQTARVDRPVAEEEPLRIEVNGQEVAVLMCSPGQEKELAVGFCLSEGLVSDWKAVLVVRFCEQEEEGGGNLVSLQVKEEAWRPRPAAAAARLIRSGCGAVPLEEADLDLTPLGEGPQVPLDLLLGLRRRMQQAQSAYARSGGVHGAGLFSPDGELLAAGEDVGRHNAVDKAIGAALLQGLSPAGAILLSTGRASYDLVTKAVRMGLPIVLSFSAPTSLALRLADLYRCTLGGYLRSQSVRLYTWPGRVSLPTLSRQNPPPKHAGE